MDIIKILNKRYATKEFDSEKKIPEVDLKKIEALLQLSPSSTNVQPWHFILATSEAGKKRISKATEGFYVFNEKKVLDASAVVVFASKTDLTEEYLWHILEKEDQDGRFAKEEFKKSSQAGRAAFVNTHKYDYKDLQHWMEKQVYLNLGNFLLGVAALGLDAVPMEGFHVKVLDEEFGLRERGYTSTVLVAIGYRRDTDFNAVTPKSRLEQEEIIETV